MPDSYSILSFLNGFSRDWKEVHYNSILAVILETNQGKEGQKLLRFKRKKERILAKLSHKTDVLIGKPGRQGKKNYGRNIHRWKF